MFVVDAESGVAQPVAFESSTSGLIAFLAAMDEAVAPFDAEGLAEALATAIRG